MSMLDFLIPERLQRVLAAVLLSPDRSYSVSELIAIADVGQGMGHRTVRALEEAGVIKGQRVGNQRRLQANQDHPLFAELRALAMKSFGLVDRIREKMKPFKDRIDLAFVFGSVAVMRDRPDSDIDLLVVGRLPTFELYQAASELEKEFGREVHLVVYDPDEWLLLLATDPVIKKIAAGPKLWVVGEDAASGGPGEPSERALASGSASR